MCSLVSNVRLRMASFKRQTLSSSIWINSGSDDRPAGDVGDTGGTGAADDEGGGGGFP